MSNPKTVREYIWERCEMDDTKTQEIINALCEIVESQKVDIKKYSCVCKVNIHNQVCDDIIKKIKGIGNESKNCARGTIGLNKCV